ncbi:hypothetical protein [Streptomyces sp. NPDC058424]
MDSDIGTEAAALVFPQNWSTTRPCIPMTDIFTFDACVDFVIAGMAGASR